MIDDACLTPLCQHVNGQNKTCAFDTEGLLTVASLCGIVVSLSLFK